MPRLTSDQRQRALGMLQAGVGYRVVARRLGCHHTTITRLRQREADTGSANDRQRSGRPRTTDDAQDHHIRLQHLRDRFRTAVQTARETPGRYNDRVSASTIRRHLHASNLRAHRPYPGNIDAFNAQRWWRTHSLLALKVNL